MPLIFADPQMEPRDKRVTVGKSVTVIRPVGPVGAPGAKSRPWKRPTVHSGKAAHCDACNPLTAERARRAEAKLAKRR